MWNPFARAKNGAGALRIPETPEEMYAAFETYLRDERPMDFFFEFLIMEIVGELSPAAYHSIQEFGHANEENFETRDWHTEVIEKLQLSDTFDIAVLDRWIQAGGRQEDGAIELWPFAKALANDYFADDSTVDVWDEGELDAAKARIEAAGLAPDKDWEARWDERLAFLESLFGESADMVAHAVVPFDMGPEAGGGADVVFFDHFVDGRLSVTAELIGEPGQVRGKLGAYELAIAHRDEDENWGPELISQLANYTMETVLNPGETMNLGESVPDDSKISGFLFCELGRGEFRGEPCGVLLCLGITNEEAIACQAGKSDCVLQALQDAGVYPFTDFNRHSVVG